MTKEELEFLTCCIKSLQDANKVIQDANKVINDTTKIIEKIENQLCTYGFTKDFIEKFAEEK